MSNEPNAPDVKVHEIVIVRRRSSDDEDDHHGGVWKVAFADFMTAMMAFFLVLWIVNSTTKETRNSLARYFNPIRLSDTTPARRGLKDPQEDQFDAKGVDIQQKGHAQKKEKAEPSDRATAERDDVGGASPSVRAVTHANPGGAKGEGGFEDPFVVQPLSARKADRDFDGLADVKDKGPEPGAHIGLNSTEEAHALLFELQKRLGSARFNEIGEALTISPADDGVLISLTDRSDFGMFAVGSAAPQPRMVEALAAIAEILPHHEGAIVIRGYTDSRPYRGGESDNWRLSSLRAWTAYQVLVKNGLADARVERIESYADHKPQVPDNGQAPQNRRIEILIRAARR